MKAQGLLEKIRMENFILHLSSLEHMNEMKYLSADLDTTSRPHGSLPQSPVAHNLKNRVVKK
jgi:hypothetical protein